MIVPKVIGLCVGLMTILIENNNEDRAARLEDDTPPFFSSPPVTKSFKSYFVIIKCTNRERLNEQNYEIFSGDSIENQVIAVN